MAPMIEDDDLIRTLSDGDDIADEPIDGYAPVLETNGTAKRKRAETKQSAIKKQKPAAQQNDDTSEKASDILSDFEFDNTDRNATLGDFDGWDTMGSGEDDSRRFDALVARHKLASVEEDGDDDEPEAEGSEFGSLGEDGDDHVRSEEASNGDETDAKSNAEDADGPVAPMDDARSEVEPEAEDEVEVEKRIAFFAPDTPTEKQGKTVLDSTFTAMSLSRPILKGLSEVGFSSPTPIQKKAIPVALEGKDIVGGAVTGSGKTAAFIIPILERLLYRSKRVATTRVAILMPTRELALQCLTVAKKLAAFTDITFGRAIGGLNSREQEKELKQRPDIVIATPGRFIDFMRNSSFFQVDTIEILVLDEADRMLEEGFADELNEILNTIPKSRQTLLFSATMTSRVDDLIRVGLQRPVRLMVDAQKATTSGLVQEFIRLRPGREGKRLGYLMHLCSEVHPDRAIIFFRQKKEVHRVRIVFALCNMTAAELHGNMSQEQRIQAIESFRSGRASFLLATDLASRGLDIKGIETVINYEAPQTHDIYLHRVGRTARAGRKGVSCTLAAEPDRKVVKAAVKTAKMQGASIRQRTIDPHDADAWQARCDALQKSVEHILREEKEEKVLQSTERDIIRASNIVEHKEEIQARPKKTWFQSEKEKVSAKQKGAEVLNGPVEDAGMKHKREKGKLSNKQKKTLQDKDERRAGKEWKKRKVGSMPTSLNGKMKKKKAGAKRK